MDNQMKQTGYSGGSITKADLAQMYKLPYGTFRKWLKEVFPDRQNWRTKWLNPNEIEQIFKEKGKP
jgi:hypothetical protein